jgi:hypothetical protein
VTDKSFYHVEAPDEPESLSGAELRSLLRAADRSANWLANRVGLSRTQVVRWQVGGVPEKHRARVRQLLPPAPKP